MNRFTPGATNGTPIPAPQFFQEPKTFSSKKARTSSLNDSLPPRPPVKSAPPVSRIFSHKPDVRAQPISFKSTDASGVSLLSPQYNTHSKELYFDQCFQIQEKLGVGSFGEVFKVRSKEDGKFYAVKKSRDRFKGESDRRRKLEEVNKHERLPAHPNCVGFVRAWQERDHLYIQTELCQTSLSNYAEQNHNIPEFVIWKYLVDLLMALKHLHNHDLVHMDIKPENIFISDNDTCKLGDFGLVLDLLKEVDYSEAQEGDPKYLAPELMMGKFGKPADVFSLGISILELASDLDLPRGGQLWHELRSQHLPKDFLRGLSGELKAVVRWMMEPDHTKRPTVDELLSSHLIKEIYHRRKREQALQSALQTPPQPKGTRHPSQWDHSFSDDDTFEDEGISIHNNSMGLPFDCSTSSEESIRDRDGLCMPSSNSERKQVSTPAYMPHLQRMYLAKASESPLSVSCHPTLYCSSPVQCSPSQRFVLKRSVTPNCTAHEEMMDMQLNNKLGIAPKNLLMAFENVSSEEIEEDASG